MAKLDDLRRSFQRTADADGDPSVPAVPHRKPNLDAIRNRKGKRLYQEIPGTVPDAELMFGKYRGRFVSDLASHPPGAEEPSYLQWLGIQTEFCPPALAEIIKDHLETYGHNCPW